MTDDQNGHGRRDFLKYVGAGFVSLNAAACVRKPVEHILPFSKRPEDLVPGEPRQYATSWNFGESVQGMLVRSMDGRPTKIEGNPNHPLSRGSTNTWAQASVLELYSPERTRVVLLDGAIAGEGAFDDMLKTLGQQLGQSQGNGLAVLCDDQPSPTLHRLLGELRGRHPKLRLFAHDGAGDERARAGAALVGVTGVSFSPQGSPRIIATFDADPFATEGDVVAYNRLFADGRRAADAKAMNRLYAAGPALTLTAANADHRLSVKGAEVGDLLAALSELLRQHGLALPALRPPAEKKDLPFVKVLAEDLLANKGASLILVGERQPPPVHALGILLNAALGSFGTTLQVVRRTRLETEKLSALAEAIRAKSIQQLLILGGNPVHDAPVDLGLADLIGQVPLSIYLGMQRDETAVKAKWHVPRSHFLEAWGDLVARDGTLSIQQPLIAPLYPSTRSSLELVGSLLGAEASGYKLVKQTHQALAPDGFEKAWQSWLHDGVVPQAKPEPVTIAPDGTKLAAVYSPSKKTDGLELDFIRDPSVLDGRFSASPWLQELPDPITKLSWDNAALISPVTAAQLGVANGAMVRLGHQARELKIAVFIQAGTADGVVVLPLGYGRLDCGKYASSGFQVETLRREETPWILAGASLAPTGETYELVSPQGELSQHQRPLVRSASLTDFIDEPNFVQKFETVEPDDIKSLLWTEPNKKDGHQWGMTVDLSSCTACGACTVACQAENNIPWVGKEQVKLGRVMHWIRIDRYLEEEKGALAFQAQPMACAQCETAPCENVCPVGATTHSPDGLNDMAYNRCIGTRYCNNNCPYKVRRFNFYNYPARNDEEYGVGIAMQRNPDVTVRFRGVMEKCTYCVQKISRARIQAKSVGDGIIPDGTIQPACASACPTQAITFGNINDPESRVAKSKAQSRNYTVLSELNIRPRTTYLARINNPNPKLPRG
jgi:Fe-S-cluster-containing dehydrogenase component